VLLQREGFTWAIVVAGKECQESNRQAYEYNSRC